MKALQVNIDAVRFAVAKGKCHCFGIPRFLQNHRGFGMVSPESLGKFFWLMSLLFLAVGCKGVFTNSEVKEIGQIREINGSCSVEVELPHVSAGWNIKIGDPEINIDLKSRKVMIKIFNHGSSILRIWTTDGVKPMIPNSNFDWFSGTFEELWNKPPLKVYSLSPEVYRFEIVLQAENNKLQTQYPISITASWKDSM